MPSSTDIIVVGRILREAREQKGWRQADLAGRSRVGQQRISKLELGQVADPGVRDLTRLAEALEINLDQLTAPFASRPRSRRRPQLQAAS